MGLVSQKIAEIDENLEYDSREKYAVSGTHAIERPLN